MTEEIEPATDRQMEVMEQFWDYYKNTRGELHELYVYILRKDFLSLIARIKVAEQQNIPEGWKLVPIEPTDQMLRAADGFTDLIGPTAETNTIEWRCAELKDAWTALLMNAPVPPLKAYMLPYPTTEKEL